MVTGDHQLLSSSIYHCQLAWAAYRSRNVLQVAVPGQFRLVSCELGLPASSLALAH